MQRALRLLAEARWVLLIFLVRNSVLQSNRDRRALRRLRNNRRFVGRRFLREIFLPFFDWNSVRATGIVAVAKPVLLAQKNFFFYIMANIEMGAIDILIIFNLVRLIDLR